MQMAAFKAVCPLELGDKVAVKEPQAAGVREAYYLPDGHAVVLCGAVTLHTVTDIATLHFLKNHDVSFMYELDGSGRYEALTVRMPIKEYDEALKARDKKIIILAQVYILHKYTCARLLHLLIAFILAQVYNKDS